MIIVLLRTTMLRAALLSLVVTTLWPPETSPTTVLAASGSVTGGTGGKLGGNKTVGGCPATCGNLSFAYPFGIGPECSRGLDFSLTCDEKETTRPPKLLLFDGTQVIDSIDVSYVGSNDGYDVLSRNSIFVSIWRAIPMKSGVSVYNLTLEAPGKSFTYGYLGILINITGCDLDVYWFNQMAGKTEMACSTWCAAAGEEEITEIEARYNCSIKMGRGCCIAAMLPIAQKMVQLTFVHRKSGIGASRSNRTSLLRDRITIAGGEDGPDDYDFALAWSIVDQPNCTSAKKDRTHYACISNHSKCHDNDEDIIALMSQVGYACSCEMGYSGNPYILDGCTIDKGYNPKPSRADCTRRCGNISVPFPFGLEEGCFAREQFHLICTNATSSAVLQWEHYQVVDLNVHEGTMDYTDDKIEMLDFLSPEEPILFIDYGSFTSLRWVVANLSCNEAKQNTSGYACVSINSSCVEVNVASISDVTYAGYRCRCLDGFEGNPYIRNGCRDIDECFQHADICKGRVCRNIDGGFKCIECPRKTEYDPTNNKCTRSKQQVLLVGIIMGLSGGFGILLLSFVAIYFFRRWKRNIQTQLRRNYFRKNHGLLLEQLISPDKTNIFSLEELEKATDNFNPTRIIGQGGHGTVYKGILSDQRVVAIKKSKVIEHSEIKQFINEVAILSEINHRNIVKLFGCCLESEVPLLVYDYISNGSLSQVLHSASRNDVSLSWDDYIRIAVEAAGALSYLHSAASISIFHRDVKSSNILLDGNHTAKVSDFGASRLVPVDQTHIVTNVQGTYGYLDPEYFYTRQLNEKSDVYSFGVVLLELLVRKKPVFTSESGLVQNLSNYFRQALAEKEITDIVDSQVIEEATKEEILSVASLAEMCLRQRGEERPTMKQVEMELQILRKKRVISCRSSTEELGEKVNLAVKHNQRCYSLEEEFMESATLPR